MMQLTCIPLVPKDTIRLDSLKSISLSKRQGGGSTFGVREDGASLDQIEEDLVEEDDGTPVDSSKRSGISSLSLGKPQSSLTSLHQINLIQRLKNSVLTSITQLLEDI